MKTTTKHTAVLAVVCIAFIGLAAVAVGRYIHRPEPEPTVPVSQLVREREAAIKAGDAKVKSVQAQLDASQIQATTANNQKLAACARLAKARINAPECQ